MMPKSGSELETVAEPQPLVYAAQRQRPLPKRRRPRRWVRWAKWGVALIILSGTIGGWEIWSRRQAAIAQAASSAAQIVTVQRATVEKSVDSSGGVKSNADVEIKCRASGEVVKLPFDVSDVVKKGDLVCQLDPTDEMLEVRRAEVAVLQSRVKLEQAKDDLEESRLNLETTRRKDESDLAYAKVRAANLQMKAQRQQELFAQKLGSQEDLETAQTDAASAQADFLAAQIAVEELQQKAIELKSKEQSVALADAELQADQVALDTQKQQLAYTTVNSPMDGVVTKLTVQRGTIVASGTDAINGGTAILTLSDLSELFVSAKVDESDIGQVKVGQDARIAVSAFPDRTFSGKVVRVAPVGSVDANIVTFEVIIRVLDPDRSLLRPEMTGNTTIIQERRVNVLTLPPMAVTSGKDGSYVTMADGQHRAVKVGLRSADYVEILSGLKEGDRVSLSNAELPTRWTNRGDDDD